MIFCSKTILSAGAHAVIGLPEFFYFRQFQLDGHWFVLRQKSNAGNVFNFTEEEKLLA